MRLKHNYHHVLFWRYFGYDERGEGERERGGEGERERWGRKGEEDRVGGGKRRGKRRGINIDVGKGNYQLPVTKGEFIGIVLGVAFFLIILSTVITYSVMRRKNNYQTIH